MENSNVCGAAQGTKTLRKRGLIEERMQVLQREGKEGGTKNFLIVDYADFHGFFVTHKLKDGEPIFGKFSKVEEIYHAVTIGKRCNIHQ